MMTTAVGHRFQRGAARPGQGRLDTDRCSIILVTGPGDGEYPKAGLIFDDQGALYGTTYEGGAHGYGTVFKLTPPAQGKDDWAETVSIASPAGATAPTP